ncbi:Spo0E family sporulation regulatory protein-aspartic acid phosphatase [Schnuerera ultunensis]|uniref:Spo0E family sporulation regulatory protein-aspartic acid phosphatase n=1 Tax=Schnuerera ultunensis TaxID=45497 RepID=UPI0009DFE53B
MQIFCWKRCFFIKKLKLVELKKEIEDTREQLHELINSKDSNLTDDNIVALSQLLDKLVYKYYEIK